MKKWQKLCVAAIAIGSTSSVFSCAGCAKETPFVPFAKTYVQPEQLGFAEGGIYIQIEGDWKQTSAIHSDDDGLYIDNVRERLCATMPPRTLHPEKQS